MQPEAGERAVGACLVTHSLLPWEGMQATQTSQIRDDAKVQKERRLWGIYLEVQKVKLQQPPCPRLLLDPPQKREMEGHGSFHADGTAAAGMCINFGKQDMADTLSGKGDRRCV